MHKYTPVFPIFVRVFDQLAIWNWNCCDDDEMRWTCKKKNEKFETFGRHTIELSRDIFIYL